MTTLKSPIDEYTHIIHVADCHIRLTKRHDEYYKIFDKLYIEIEKSPLTTVVVIVGDIFHSKSDLSPECIQMASDLFKKISLIRPLVIVAGNHDCNLVNKNRLDSLTPIIESLNSSNIFYLRNTGLYGFGNILWNNMSVFDDPQNYILFKDIPKVYKNKYKHIIALFHGAVNNASLDNGYTVTNPIIMPELFDNHNIALLGDIHKHQDIELNNNEVVISENDIDNYDMNYWEVIEEIDMEK